MLEVLFWLLVMHALWDYQLQLDPLATMKDPYYCSDRKKFGPWWWSMGAHGLLNGGGVAWATGSWELGVAEAVVHSITDTLKCMGVLNTYEDQIIHILSKVVWAWTCTQRA